MWGWLEPLLLVLAVILVGVAVPIIGSRLLFRPSVDSDFGGLEGDLTVSWDVLVRALTSPLHSLFNSKAVESAETALVLPSAGSSLLTNWRIHAEIVGEYARVFSRPAPVMSESSTRKDPMPFLLLHAVTFPEQLRVLSDPSWPFALIGSVHLSCKVVQWDSLSPRAALRVLVSADPLTRAHRRGSVVGIRVQCWHASDPSTSRPRWEMLNSLLFFHKRPRGPAVDAPPVPAAVEPLERGPLPMTAAHADSWSHITGDVNPIHTSDWWANALGMGPRRIVHGMCALDAAMPALLQRVGASELHASLGANSMSSLPVALEAKFVAPLPVPQPECELVILEKSSHRVLAEIRTSGAPKPFQTVLLASGPEAEPLWRDTA
jgi:acyl dehydratase